MKQLITYGSRQLNQFLDDTLLLQFPSQTLMQLAGIAIAQVSQSILNRQNKNNVCVLVGPGNNGGDGLVAARHLKMMGCCVELVVFKEVKGRCQNLMKLCQWNQIGWKLVGRDFGDVESQEAQNRFSQYLGKYDLIIDGIFGFPFSGELRIPYNYYLPRLKPFGNKILSIDIPSGWDANEGNINNLFIPKYLVSLSIPKKCSQNFEGQHYLGGRFIPEKLRKQLKIILPEFKRTAMYVKL